jgi:hypothetical protein
VQLKAFRHPINIFSFHSRLHPLILQTFPSYFLVLAGADMRRRHNKRVGQPDSIDLAQPEIGALLKQLE